MEEKCAHTSNLKYANKFGLDLVDNIYALVKDIETFFLLFIENIDAILAEKLHLKRSRTKKRIQLVIFFP